MADEMHRSSVQPSPSSGERRNVALSLDLGALDVRWSDLPPGNYGDVTVYPSLPVAVRDALGRCRANAQPWLDAIEDLSVMSEQDVRDA